MLRRAMAYAARAMDDIPAAMSWFAEAADRARGGGLITLALEADVNRAQLLAEAGDLTTAFELARAAHAESCVIGSPVNEVWAQSILAQLELRREVAAGLDAVSLALDAARRIGYPAAIAVNLRTLAWGLTRVGRYRDAAETLTELFDHLLARGGVAELRGALLTTAELLHALGNESLGQACCDGLFVAARGPDELRDGLDGPAAAANRAADEPAGRGRDRAPGAPEIPRRPAIVGPDRLPQGGHGPACRRASRRPRPVLGGDLRRAHRTPEGIEGHDRYRPADCRVRVGRSTACS